MVDPVSLTARLVRCASVTPADDGALGVLEEVLAAHGFACFRADRGGIGNLVARWGDRAHARTFGFNGHTDVVPEGDAAAWSSDPFGAEITDGMLMGRGAVDMKSGVAAFVAAACERVSDAPPDGAILLAITGDEEGDATDGTAAILDWMSDAGEWMSVCIVGEPTSRERLGDMMKIGRRGSMTAHFTAEGRQGHAAYPDRARNPVPAMARLVDRLSAVALDAGTAHFDPSTLAVTTFDTGNPANNVIPGQCRATVNIRFNDAQSADGLTAWLGDQAGRVTAETGIAIDMATKISGESFLTAPGPLSELVAGAVAAETGIAPELSTSGGTSDARFVKDHCPVVEFGLVGRGMHQTDEAVPVQQIAALTSIYRRILDAYFD